MKGKVVGPSEFDPVARVAVIFPGNKGPTGCFATELSRTWPPPALPGKYTIKETIYYCAERWAPGPGYLIEYGAKGDVTGPADDGDERCIVHRRIACHRIA